MDDVYQRDDETVIDIRFRLSSAKLRSACEAQLITDRRDFLEREKIRLKMPALKVEVKKISAWELFMAIQDRATGLTLASDVQHIAQLGDEVPMSFRFKPSALSTFMRVHREGKLQFKPYYKVKADQIITGEKDTQVSYEVGLTVKRLLTNQQREGSYPILQDDVNRIAPDHAEHQE